MDLEHQIEAMGKAAKAAARRLATVPTPVKNRTLVQAAAQFRKQGDVLLAANAQDVALGKSNGLSSALLDRLTLTPARIDTMAKGLEIIADLPDPVGETMEMWRRPN